MKRILLVLSLIAATVPVLAGCGGQGQQLGKVTVTGTEGYAPGEESPAPDAVPGKK